MSNKRALSIKCERFASLKRSIFPKFYFDKIKYDIKGYKNTLTMWKLGFIFLSYNFSLTFITR